MNAIEPAQRAPHHANAKALFAKVSKIVELENGFGFCFDDDPNVLARLAEFITLEKLCCPFFGFIIEVEPEGGAIWLKLTGRRGVKPFIRAEIGEIIGRPIVPTGFESV
jgi:hypothetical protein